MNWFLLKRKSVLLWVRKHGLKFKTKSIFEGKFRSCQCYQKRWKQMGRWEGQSVKWKWRRCWSHFRLQSNTRWEKAEEEEWEWKEDELPASGQRRVQVLSKAKQSPTSTILTGYLETVILNRESPINKPLATTDLGQCNFKNVTKSKRFQGSNKRDHLISEWEEKWVATWFFVEVWLQEFEARESVAIIQPREEEKCTENLGWTLLPLMADWICFARSKGVRKQETQEEEVTLSKARFGKVRRLKRLRDKWCSLSWALRCSTSIRWLSPLLHGCTGDGKEMRTKQMLGW